MAIFCVCKKDDCNQQINVDAVSLDRTGNIRLLIIDKDGDENLMYLDPNETIRLIKELQDAVIDLMKAG